MSRVGHVRPKHKAHASPSAHRGHRQLLSGFPERIEDERAVAVPAMDPIALDALVEHVGA